MATAAFFLRTLDQLGLTAKLKPKFIPLTGRGCMVAIPNREVEVCATPATTVASGVQMLARFPAEIQTYVVIAAGASAVSSGPEAAHSFVKFLLSPQAVAVFQALNFEAAAR